MLISGCPPLPLINVQENCTNIPLSCAQLWILSVLRYLWFRATTILKSGPHLRISATYLPRFRPFSSLAQYNCKWSFGDFGASVRGPEFWIWFRTPSAVKVCSPWPFDIVIHSFGWCQSIALALRCSSCSSTWTTTDWRMWMSCKVGSYCERMAIILRSS